MEPELKAKFIAIINPLPDNELNPWKNEFTRWRNYCLFLTMILCGTRKGESLGIKLHHLNLIGSRYSNKKIEIKKDEHINFPHKVRPTVKTLARNISISDSLASIFEHYITKIRPKAKNHKKTDYLFLSLKDGKPIGIATPNDSFKVLIEKFPEFKGKLTPHRLRNTYFDALRDEIDSSFEATGPIAKDGIMSQLMTYAGGWTTGSKMPIHYAKGSIQRKVANYSLSLQCKLLGDSKK